MVGSEVFCFGRRVLAVWWILIFEGGDSEYGFFNLKIWWVMRWFGI